MKTIIRQANGFIETEFAAETPERVDYLYKRIRVRQPEAAAVETNEEVEEMKAELSTVVVEEQSDANNDGYTYQGESVEEILARIDAKVATHEMVKAALLQARKYTRKTPPKNNVQKLIRAAGLEPKEVYYGLCELEKKINKIFK